MLLISINSYSIENFILTNDGSKINIKPSFFRIDTNEKTISYKLSNSDVESKMKFKDFDFINIGKNKFKTYKLQNSKEVNGYFVLAETATKTLLLSTEPDEDEESTKVNYVFYVVDLTANIIDSMKFDNLKNSKSGTMRGDILFKIQFYFNNCPLLMTRISSFDNLFDQDNNLKILDFFNSPVYINCL